MQQQQQHDVMQAAAVAPSGYSPFASSSQNSFLPPTPPRGPHPQHTPQAAHSLGRLGSHPFAAAPAIPLQGQYHGSDASTSFSFGNAVAGGGGGGYGSLVRAGSSGYGIGFGGGSTPTGTNPNSPSMLPPALTAEELLHSGAAAAMNQQFVAGLRQQGRGSGGGWGFGAADSLNPPGLPPAYHHSPLSRSATVTVQQLLQQQHQQQQQQAAMGRSFSLDADVMAEAQAAAAGGRWGGMRQDMSAGGYGDPGRLFGAVFDMKSLTAALSHVQAGTGDVQRMLASCTFRPRLPGLTKLVSQMSREGHWAKALEVYESLNAVGVRPDTTITNAAISACDKGGQWEKALQLFRAMPEMGMERDAITYSALISALSKGRQWAMAIDVFNHMVAEGVECDAVTCCSLITALDKGGQWQLAEQVFIQMYQSHTQFHVLLEGMQQESPGANNKVNIGSPSPLSGTFTAAALSALSIQEDQLPPAEQLARLAPPGLRHDAPEAATGASGGGASGGGAAATTNASGKRECDTMQAADLQLHELGFICAPASGTASLLPGLAESLHHNVRMSLSGQPGSLLSGLNAFVEPLYSQEVTALSVQSPDRLHSDQAQPDCQDSGIVRTLSGAWSKVIGANRAAAAAAAEVTSNGLASAAAGTAAAGGGVASSSSTANSSRSSCSSGSGGLDGNTDSLLASTDAIVHLPDAAAGKPEGSSSSEAGKQSHSSPNSVLTLSLSAQLLEVGMFSPGHEKDAAASTASPHQSAFAQAAAAGPSDAAAAGSGGAAGLTSPTRPPMHPLCRYPTGPATTAADSLAAVAAAGAGRLLGSSPSRQRSLQRAGSFATSPVGAVGLRLGRAGSLNSKKSSPNRVCCNALLAAYARAVPPRWEQALRLLEVMWQCGGELNPDIVSYNTVMKACGNAQQTDIAFELYHHMQQRGIEPTVATYGTLITIASEAQAYARVKESWGWLQASGLPVHITCVNSYLTALIKEDNWDAAVELFNQLKANQLGVRPNSVTYNILMSACLARDKPQHAKALFDEMTASSLSPSLISYNTMLHAYAKMGAWQESLALLQHLCSSSAVRPSTTSFNTVFCTLSNVAAAVGDLDKPTVCARALEVYALMLDQPSITPDTTLYRNMVSTFAACNAHNMVLQLALLMSQQGHSLDPATAAAALDALQAEGSWQLAGQLLRGCYGAGTVVSQFVIQRLLLACAEQGAWKAAREVLQICASAGQLDKVAQLLQQYRSQVQAAHASPQPALSQGLMNPDTLDELLFLTFLQGQFATRGWQQGVALYNQLKADRGAQFASGNAGVLAALLELLVVCGGIEGLLAAVQVADACHTSGAMGHYLLQPSGLGASSSSRGSPTSCTPQSALGSNLLSPQQQLILQLEQAAATSSPQVSGLFSSADGGLATALGNLGLGGDNQALNPSVSQALSFLDVRGCSAVEGVVLLLSWLGQVVQLQASGLKLQCEIFRIFTGSWGAVSGEELAAVVLHTPVVPSAAVIAASSSSTAAGTAAASAPAGPAACSDHQAAEGSNGTAATAGASDAPALQSSTTTASDTAGSGGSSISSTSPGPAAEPHAPATPAAANGAFASAASTASATAATTPVQGVPVPSSASVHAAVLAVLSGNLGPMLCCSNAMELLVPFSTAGKLALGLVCCSAQQLLLPDEMQGGGVALPAQELQGAIAAAMDASRV